MKVLLVSTYELGHQPLHLASPAAALLRAGHAVRCLDLSVQPWDQTAIDWAQAVAFSVPMHTAMRLALGHAAAVRRSRPDLPICFYGLYAPVSHDAIVGSLVDRAIAGEYEPELVQFVDELDGADGPPRRGLSVDLGRHATHLPARHLLPPLNSYAHLVNGGDHRLTGYVEASHGCVHRCRHCPLPTVYDGRIRIVAEELVLQDIAQLYELGARHITFGDPDFLNGWRHSLRIVNGMHERFPDLTFDVTAKIEHILRHAGVWNALGGAGCLFVVSAIECVNDEILRRLDKGHTAAQAVQAVELLRSHGIELRPSFMPFTPWTAVEDVLDILEFVEVNDLLGNVDPVQYMIRLLLPEGSLLLDQPDIQPYLGPYDAGNLTYAWTAADGQTEPLQRRLARLVQENLGADEPIAATFGKVVQTVAEFAAPKTRDWSRFDFEAAACEGKPRLTEPWFC